MENKNEAIAYSIHVLAEQIQAMRAPATGADAEMLNEFILGVADSLEPVLKALKTLANTPNRSETR